MTAARAASAPAGTRCENRCRDEPLPAGFPLELAASHPRYRYRLTPGARCELDVGHEPPHRNGLLSWFDPPLFVVVRGGRGGDVEAARSSGGGKRRARPAAVATRTLEAEADAPQHVAAELPRVKPKADRAKAHVVRHPAKDRTRRPRPTPGDQG